MLTEEQKKSFVENGFVILDDFFSETERIEFRNMVIHLIKINLKKAAKENPEINIKDFEGKELDEGIIKLEEIDHQYVADIYDTIFQTPQFLRITAKKEISKCINQLLNREENDPTYIDQSRCRIDPPLDPNKRTCGWHQEVFYYIPKSDFVQTWAPLIHNATKENGAIEICPTSHKKGIAKQNSLEGDELYKFIVDESVIKEYKPETVELKVGQLLIFNSKLIHKSGKNISKQVRYSLVGINHNLDNEYFEPPKLVVSQKEEKMKEYYSQVFDKHE
jgi:phytanoyl-CoA hydroxylase